jgi:hypothetical protein
MGPTVCELDGLIADLPEGLDTVIGERGVKLGALGRDAVPPRKATKTNGFPKGRCPLAGGV